MRISALFLLLVSVLIVGATAAKAESEPPIKRIMDIVDGLKHQLGISEPIQIKIAPSNSLAFSIEPADQRTRFVLSVDRTFLTKLDDEELTAAVAHELGHAWIYTHHPYLHTEALANQIAMRAVKLDSLKKLYVKLWQFEGTNDDNGELLGLGTFAALKTQGVAP